MLFARRRHRDGARHMPVLHIGIPTVAGVGHPAGHRQVSTWPITRRENARLAGAVYESGDRPEGRRRRGGSLTNEKREVQICPYVSKFDVLFH